MDAIEGLSPAIAIEQRGGGLNPRSTVATVTEIREHLRIPREQPGCNPCVQCHFL